jgi:hypothetical protein
VTELVPSEPSEFQAQAAFDVDQRIRHTLRDMRRMWMELARDLYFFTEAEMWRSLGHPSMESYLAQPEIGLDRRWVYNLKSIYSQLVIDRGIPETDLALLQPSKITQVLPAIRRGLVETDEALSDAESLSKEDLRVRYTFLMGSAQRGLERPHREAGWDATDEPAWAICPHCGSRYQVNG